MKTIHPESRFREFLSDAWDALKSLTLLEYFVILIFAGIMSALVFGFYRDATVRRPAAFAAWTKLTGNPKHLTYEEWNNLTRVMNQPEQ